MMNIHTQKHFSTVSAEVHVCTKWEYTIHLSCIQQNLKKYGKQRQDRLCIIALHTQVVELTNICGIHVSVGMRVHTAM